MPKWDRLEVHRSWSGAVATSGNSRISLILFRSRLKGFACLTSLPIPLRESPPIRALRQTCALRIGCGALLEPSRPGCTWFNVCLSKFHRSLRSAAKVEARWEGRAVYWKSFFLDSPVLTIWKYIKEPSSLEGRALLCYDSPVERRRSAFCSAVQVKYSFIWTVPESWFLNLMTKL